MAKAIGVRLHDRGKLCYARADEYQLQSGDAVVLGGEQGDELGFCSGETLEVCECRMDLQEIKRVATEEDLKTYEENLGLEADASRICREKIERHQLPMILTGVEYLLDRRRVIFYFTADGRVDFRELVKDLAATFHTRIELRQIGVRDEARMKGGLGICGRELCCCSFLRDFEPVSIKMAKEQNLSMNPGKISGACGRLLCCLKYEQDAYEDAHKRLPSKGDRVRTAQGDGVVLDVNLLKETVQLRLNNDNEAELLTLPASEVTVLSDKHGRKARSDEALRPGPETDTTDADTLEDSLK